MFCLRLVPILLDYMLVSTKSSVGLYKPHQVLPPRKPPLVCANRMVQGISGKSVKIPLDMCDGQRSSKPPKNLSSDRDVSRPHWPTTLPTYRGMSGPRKHNGYPFIKKVNARENVCWSGHDLERASVRWRHKRLTGGTGKPSPIPRKIRSVSQGR